MAATYTSATIRSDGVCHDISVPVGTTVSGVLAQLQRTHGITELVDEFGRLVAADEAFGIQLHPGIILYANAAVAGDTNTGRTIESETSEGAARAASTATGLLSLVLVALTGTAIIAASMRGVGWPPPLHILLAVALLATTGIFLRYAQPKHKRATLIALPLPIAVAVGILIPTPDTTWAWGFSLLVLWGGAIVAHIMKLVRPTSVSDTAIIVWLTPAILLSIVELGGIRTIVAAPIALACVTYAFYLIPSFSMRVPENQLLYLPAVMRTANSVRRPVAAKPGRITPRRIRVLLTESSTTRNALVYLTCAIILIATMLFTATSPRSTLEMWGRLVLMVAVMGVLVLSPRTSRSRTVRWVPRLTATVIAVVTVLREVTVLTGHPATAITFAHLPSGLVITVAVLGVGATVAGLWLRHDVYMPLLSRTGDILQTLSIVAVLPAAIIASGAFATMRAL